MSTWTCKASGVVLAAALVLSGCAGGLGGGTGVTRLPVSSGAVTVAGPPGFCVDRSASDPGADPAVVILASCASVTGSPRADRPSRNALLTASVSQAPSRAPQGAELAGALAAFFSSDAGRAAIARSGAAADVTIADMDPQDNGLVLRIEDTGSGRQGLSDSYWREVFALNGRLVTLSALGYAARPLSRDQGRAVLGAFRGATVAASGRRDAPDATGSRDTVGEENSPLDRLLSLARLRR